MTHQEVALDLLSYVGIYGFAPASSSEEVGGEDDTDINKAVSAINAAMQEFYRKGPKSIKEAHRSAYLNTPTQVSLIIDALGNVTSSVALPAWMIGCTVLLSGEDFLNRITGIAGTSVTLFTPPILTAGTYGGTVYADAIKLSPIVGVVLDPVEIPGSHRLRPCEGRRDFELLGGNGSDHYLFNLLGYGVGTFIPLAISRKSTGTPQVYLVEQGTLGVLYLTLNPMPTKPTHINYDAYLRPETIDRTQSLNETGGADPGLEFVSIPPDMVDSVLLPMARWHFFQHPSLKNTEMRPAINLGREEALKALQGHSFTPQGAAVHARYL